MSFDNLHHILCSVGSVDERQIICSRLAVDRVADLRLGESKPDISGDAERWKGTEESTLSPEGGLQLRRYALCLRGRASDTFMKSDYRFTLGRLDSLLTTRIEANEVINIASTFQKLLCRLSQECFDATAVG